jgi:hypothetical protein
VVSAERSTERVVLDGRAETLPVTVATLEVVESVYGPLTVGTRIVASDPQTTAFVRLAPGLTALFAIGTDADGNPRVRASEPLAPDGTPARLGLSTSALRAELEARHASR